MATKAQEQRIFREAVQAALQLDEFDLSLTCDEPFALRFDDDEETWFGAVTGPDGEGQGVVLVRGPAGLRWIRDMADDVEGEDDLDRYTERIEFTLRRIGDVLPARRPALLAAGAASMRDGLVPEFSAKERNKSARDLGPRDAKRLVMAMSGLVAAFEERMEDFETEHPAGVLPTLALSGDWRRPAVAFELAAHTDDLGRSEPPVRRGGAALDWAVADERWSVAVVESTFRPDEGIAPSDPGDATEPSSAEEPELTLISLVVADTDAKTVVGWLPIAHATPRRAAQAFARGLFVSLHGRLARRFAGKLTFVDPELCEFVAEALDRDGVECATVERDDAIDHVRAHLREMVKEADAALARGELASEEYDRDDEEWDDDAPGVGHVHGAGCAHASHGHEFGDDDDDAFGDAPEPPPDAVEKILRDAGLSGGGAAPPR